MRCNMLQIACFISSGLKCIRIIGYAIMVGLKGITTAFNSMLNLKNFYF